MCAFKGQQELSNSRKDKQMCKVKYKKKPLSKPIGIAFEEESVASINQLAEKRNKGFAEIVRTAVRAYVKKTGV